MKQKVIDHIVNQRFLFRGASLEHLAEKYNFNDYHKERMIRKVFKNLNKC